MNEILRLQETEMSKVNKCFGYRKVPKFLDARKFAVIILKLEKKRFYHIVMHPKESDSIVNSEDPDQTTPLGAV